MQICKGSGEPSRSWTSKMQPAWVFLCPPNPLVHSWNSGPFQCCRFVTSGLNLLPVDTFFTPSQFHWQNYSCWICILYFYHMTFSFHTWPNNRHLSEFLKVSIQLKTCLDMELSLCSRELTCNLPMDNLTCPQSEFYVVTNMFQMRAHQLFARPYLSVFAVTINTKFTDYCCFKNRNDCTGM